MHGSAIHEALFIEIEAGIVVVTYTSITTPINERTPSISSMRDLVNYKEELESGKLVVEHQEAYDEFFVVKTTPKCGMKVLYNSEAVSLYISRYAGFHAILSNSIKDPVKALQIYRGKDVVEKCFSDLKNHLDMKRLRMHRGWEKTRTRPIFDVFFDIFQIEPHRQ